MTGLPAQTFAYDGENRLIAATEPGTPAISYVYGGDGKRVQKTVGASVTTYVYDASYSLLLISLLAALAVAGAHNKPITLLSAGSTFIYPILGKVEALDARSRGAPHARRLPDAVFRRGPFL
jgi:YD repeat-containing protein